MRVSIVACGSSARDWDKVPCDLSIGCNDMYKFGIHPDWLVVVNMPGKFEAVKNGNVNRLKTIIETKPKRFLTHAIKPWQQWFPKAEYIKNRAAFHERAKILQRGFNYTSKTSPMIAMSLGLNAGAAELVLWGVDMKDHRKYAEGTATGNKEITVYLRFIELIEKKGMRVYLGSGGSALEKYVPILKV